MTEEDFRREVLKLLKAILTELQTNAANRKKALAEYGLKTP